MIEKEVKILNIDEDKFIEDILNLGAVAKTQRLKQARYVYDFKPKSPHKWIRLRTNGIKTTLATKEILDRNSIAGTEENEIEVSSFEGTNKILESLGYKHRNYQENYRQVFQCGEVEISVDSWPLIPTYAEFEAENEDAIKDLIKKMEIPSNKVTTLDVASIYKKIYKINSLKISKLKFDEGEDEGLLEHN